MNTLSSLLNFIGGKIQTSQKRDFVVDTNVIENPETISVYQTGNVVEVTMWGTRIKVNGPITKTKVITNLPRARTQCTAYMALGGTNSYNIQGNLYNYNGDMRALNMVLKSGYEANTQLYCSLVYFTH